MLPSSAGPLEGQVPILSWMLGVEAPASWKHPSQLLPGLPHGSQASVGGEGGLAAAKVSGFGLRRNVRASRQQRPTQPGMCCAIFSGLSCCHLEPMQNTWVNFPRALSPQEFILVIMEPCLRLPGHIFGQFNISLIHSCLETANCLRYAVSKPQIRRLKSGKTSAFMGAQDI